MYSFAELNDFIIKHTDAKYFDDDLKLYKKHFPNSKLIPELERAPDYAKKNLDERMLFELLNNQDSCIDCIWENRGFIFDGSKLVPINVKDENAAFMSPEKQLIFEELIKTDLSISKHNDLKKFVFALGLDKNCKNHKKETYLTELNSFMIEYAANVSTSKMNAGNHTSVDESKPLPSVANTESHSDQIINLMNKEKQELTEKVENLELENEDLKDQIEDHELQKEDLESQLEDTESEKEAAIAELAEAKKKEDQEQSIQE